MRTASQTLLFVVLALLTFAALVVSFPFVARQVLNFPFDDYARGGSKGQFYLILWIAAHVIGMFVYYLLFAWAFRRTAGLTDALAARRAVLLLGAIGCGGYLLYALWKGFSTTSSNLLIQRIALSGLILAVCGAALDAIRNGPMPSEDFTEYRNH